MFIAAVTKPRMELRALGKRSFRIVRLNELVARFVSGTGETETATPVDLHGRLTGMPRPATDAAKRERLNRRLRQAFYQGSREEAASRGRPLGEAELGRVLGVSG